MAGRKHKTVGARELKTRLGTYLRRVEHGETLVVTERGRPVAELKPLPRTPADEREAKLDQLVRGGVLSRKHGGTLEPFDPIEAKPGVSLSRIIIEDREDRF